jgi:formate dehydrogenase maturation protein FdhE
VNAPTEASAVVLACTGCDHAWEVSLDDMAGEAAAAGATGCPECGGWTWVGQLTEPAGRRAGEHQG